MVSERCGPEELLPSCPAVLTFWELTSPVSLLSEASLLRVTSHQSHISSVQVCVWRRGRGWGGGAGRRGGRGSGSKEASLINSSLGLLVNCPLPVVSIVQGNLNSDTVEFEAGLSWNEILHLSGPLSLDTGDRNYSGVLL